MIDRLCRGDQERIKKMLQLFIDQTPQDIEAIKEAYKRGDFAIVRKIAHRIKPVLGYYAIIKIEKDILTIERMAGRGQLSNEVATKIKHVDEVVTEVIEQMKTLC